MLLIVASFVQFSIPIQVTVNRKRKSMIANSIVNALLTNEAMNYGVVIGGAVILLCDIWLLLLHEPRVHTQRHEPGRVIRSLSLHLRH